MCHSYNRGDFGFSGGFSLGGWGGNNGCGGGGYSRTSRSTTIITRSESYSSGGYGGGYGGGWGGYGGGWGNC